MLLARERRKNKDTYIKCKKAKLREKNVAITETKLERKLTNPQYKSERPPHQQLQERNEANSFNSEVHMPL